MQEVVRRILANDFADFEGLKVEGTIVINEAIINAFITDYLNNLTVESDIVLPAPDNAPILDFPKIIRSLNVEQLQVELRDQKMQIQLKIRK